MPISKAYQQGKQDIMLELSSSVLISDFSGVLQLSLDKSRQKWLMEGIFEKYWTKPSKKKNPVELQNPAKDSMVRLGTCSMIIEPHVFEVTLYSVKEVPYTFLPPMGQGPSPASVYTPPGGNLGQGQTPLSDRAAHSGDQAQALHSQKSAPFQLPPFREGFAQFEPQGPPHILTKMVDQPRFTPVAPPPSNTSESPSIVNKDGETNPDPIIQMLAARAATNHDLKSLMKVIALGKASHSQLRVFQRHIDDLNGIMLSQKTSPISNSDFQAAQAGIRASNKSSSYQTARPSDPSAAPNLPNQPVSPSIKTEPLSQYYSQAPFFQKQKAPLSARQEINAVVFDFTAGTGDRFILPKHSILEYLPGNTQVLVSFLITRKGSTANGGTYKEKLDYYQPITLRLSTPNPRTLEPLARIVIAPDEVRAYMSDIMTRMKMADLVYLATRLPRAQEDNSTDKDKRGTERDQEVLRPIYSPPNSLFPVRDSNHTTSI